MYLKKLLRRIPFVKLWLLKLDNLLLREEFVKNQLSIIAEKSLILDAGCGSQRFRKYCSHLVYKSQDFGEFTTEEKAKIGDRACSGESYRYGNLDYTGNVWEIEEKDSTFDAILCTEVFEHIPYPVKAVEEFARLTKTGGMLILTAPSNSLRHMDPYYYYAGFSDRWFRRILDESGFDLVSLEAVGDYYSWIGAEIFRTAKSHTFLSKLFLFPALIYFLSKKKTPLSIDTLCMGYHVVAIKR